MVPGDRSVRFFMREDIARKGESEEGLEREGGEGGGERPPPTVSKSCYKPRTCVQTSYSKISTTQSKSCSNKEIHEKAKRLLKT